MILILNLSASSFLPVSYESAKACAVVIEQNDARANVNQEPSKEYAMEASPASAPSVLSELLFTLTLPGLAP